jgi:phage shock protein E
MSTWVILAAVAVAIVIVPRLLGGRRVSSNVVLEKIKAGAKIIDVRTPGEFRGGAYPNAINIPLQVLSGRLHEIPRDRPVVLYCASGLRSGSAVRVLRQAGYADVVNAGGLGSMPR